MKKIFILFILLALSLFAFNCGGGSGSSSSPKGENPGEPSVVQLLPAQFIAQTNSIITLHAKVLDGNGAPVNNIPVSFTNLSPIGVLSATTKQTNNAGIATVTLKSTTSGFSTVQAEINKGVSQVRDRKTVYFATSLNLQPYMILDVDGDSDGIYNEASDLILFETATDNQVMIRATVFNGFGQRAAFTSVTFGADSLEASFPLGSIKTTDANGEAFVLVQVDPIAIRNLGTVLNITAVADNGAFNMVSLFLKSVTVSASSSSLSANPTAINPGGTSDLTAAVKLNTGNIAPDGTAVSFVTTCGTVTPFAQTTNGVAPGTFTAPSTEGACTVTATAGGVTIGSVRILVTSGLVVIPDKMGLAIGEEAPVRVFGGIPTYTIISGSTAIATVDRSSLSSSGQSFTVTGVAQGVTTISVRDAGGTIKTVAVTVSTSGGGGGTGIPMSISPLTATVAGIQNPDSSAVDNIDFVLSNVSGGVVNCISSHPAIIASPGALPSLGGNIFTIDSNAVAATTIVTITCTDGDGFVASALVTVTPPGLSISLNPIHVIGRANPDTDDTDNVNVSVVGGVGPYIVHIEPFSLTTIVPGGPWASAVPWTIVPPIDPTNVLTNTIVTFKVTDGVGTTATAQLVVYTENTPLVASTSKENVIGLANPDNNTADDVTITVAGANGPFIVSWVCDVAATASVTSGTGSCPGGISPCVVSGIGPVITGAITFDPAANAGPDTNACTVNVTDNSGSAATLNISIWP